MIDRNAWLDFASPEQLAEARRLSDALHNADENSRQKLIAEYEEFRRKTTCDVIRRRLEPEHPRPSEDRMQAAVDTLDFIQGDLPVGAWIPVEILVQALRARGCNTNEALWCLCEQITSERCNVAQNRHQRLDDLTPEDRQLFPSINLAAKILMTDPDDELMLDLAPTATYLSLPWPALAVCFTPLPASQDGKGRTNVEADQSPELPYQDPSDDELEARDPPAEQLTAAVDDVLARVKNGETPTEKEDDLPDDAVLDKANGTYGCIVIGKKEIPLGGFTEQMVVEALVKSQRADLKTLERESGYKHPATTLSRLLKKHPALERYITMAGKKGMGGYSTTIKLPPSSTHNALKST